jgi:NitT/TauT family transport system permease protein
MGERTDQGGVQTQPPAEGDKAGSVSPTQAGTGEAAVALRGGSENKKSQRRSRASLTSNLIAALLPNRVISAGAMRIIVGVEVIIAMVLWLNSPFRVLPRPEEVARALQTLWMTEGLGPELWTSFRTNLEALGWTALLSLLLSYLTVIPVFRPLVAAVSKGRFLSLVGFTFVFTLIVGGGHPLKTSLLVFGMTVFYVTSMASIIAQIPKADFDHARTLRMGEWRVVWEVVILGTADKAFEVLRQNAAIGWMMLTMVEGIARSEGGVGAMLLNQSKHFLLAEVFAIQFVILLVGLFQDYAIGATRRLACPYADLTLERR